MRRQNIIIGFTIQFPNNVQPPQWGAPVLVTQASLVVDAAGAPLYQAAFSAQPAAADDITEEVLSAIQQQLGALGLSVARIQTEPAVPDGAAA